MSILAAALVLGPLGPAFYARAPGVGLIARTTALPAENLWVMLSSTTWAETTTGAQAISAIAPGTLFALFGRDDVDVYAVAEMRAGEVIRSLVYVSDDGGWKMVGAPQPWEADFAHEPAANMDMLIRYIQKLGFKWHAGADARFERRNFFARLVGA